MAGASVLTDIRSMIDLAIGTPETGVVDFCMLHTVLHCLAQQLHALDKPVELLGGASSLAIAPTKDVQTVAITEYIVETDTATPMKPKTIKPPPPPSAESTLLVVERVRKDSSPDRSSVSAKTGPPATKQRVDHPKAVDHSTSSAKSSDQSAEAAGAGGGAGGGGGGTGAGVDAGAYQSAPGDASDQAQGGGQTEVSITTTTHTIKRSETAPARRTPSSEKLSLVTLSKFNLLEDAVKDLKDRVYGSMPKNEQILEQVRSQTNLKAITDMWTNLNVSSRLEAAETGLTKLSSLVEDLIKEAGARGVSAMPAAFEPAGQSPAVQAPAAQAPSAQAPSAQAPAAQAPASQAPTAQAPAAQAPAALPPAAQAPAAQLPAAQAPAAQAPTAQAPAGQVPYAAVQQAPAGPEAFYAGAYMEPPAPQFVPPYPWDLLAAQQNEQCQIMVGQLQRLRSDLDLLNKTFYETIETIQASIPDIKDEIQLPPPPPPAPPIVEYLPAPPPPPPVIQYMPAPPAPPPVIQYIQQPAPATTDAGTPGAQPLQPPMAPPQVPPVAPQLVPQAAMAPGVAAGPGLARRSSGVTAGLADRLAQLERRVKECCDGMGKDKGVVSDQMSNFQDQLDHLTRKVGTLHEDFGALKLSPNLAKDLEGLMQLYRTVQDMQEQLRQVNEVARQLAGEKDDRQHHIKALLEQIEILKTIKMDREDMVEAMAEKADLRLLARKVSHDQFEMACDDLSRGLEHALGKLNTQEALWQQVLDDVQREIETKLDKMELSPLKDFFEKKLRLLQDNLKQMASLRRNVEAAGTTRRLLRDVNCISCDADAVMPMENTSAMPSKPLPAHLSMKPYLSYELDTIRKTQASNLPQRNLHDWETIEKQKPTKQPVKVRSDTDKHICNRYCGGSHTTTTPAQRVARLGHFIKQWGPDVVPLSSGMAAGDDGRLYKVSTTENANVGPGGSVDQPCTKKPKTPEPAKPAPKASVSPAVKMEWIHR